MGRSGFVWRTAGSSLRQRRLPPAPRYSAGFSAAFLRGFAAGLAGAEAAAVAAARSARDFSRIAERRALVMFARAFSPLILDMNDSYAATLSFAAGYDCCENHADCRWIPHSGRRGWSRDRSHLGSACGGGERKPPGGVWQPRPGGGKPTCRGRVARVMAAFGDHGDDRGSQRLPGLSLGEGWRTS